MIKKDNPLEHLSHEDENLLDESKKAFLIESPKWASGLLYSIAAFIVIGLIWAKFAILDEVTVGQGKVIPSSKVQVIQNLEGGILAAIYVKEGDTVKKGQVLLRIDDTRFTSNYREGLSKYLSLLATVSRLTAEEKDAKEVTYPKVIKENSPELIERENELFMQRRGQLDATLANLEKSYRLSQQEYNISKPLVDEGLMSQLELIRLEREVNDIKGKISQANDDYESNVRESYSKAQSELLQVTEALSALKDRMVRTTVLSPVKGKVKKINIATIGGIIQPGMDIMEIVPLEDTLLIEAKIKPKDIAFISPQQSAIVKFTAYDFSIYGGLEGVVEYISPDTITDEENKRPGQEESFYKILVRTKTNHLIGKDGKPLEIIPGMVCSVDILTGKKSVLEYILKPLFKAKQDALRER
jgi:membrane fusion protein, adhesin transport system